MGPREGNTTDANCPENPVMTQQEFNIKYGCLRERQSLRKRLKGKLAEELCCDRRKCVSVGLGLLPIVNVIRTYKVKEYLLGDILAGLSVAVLMIPQSMGYAMLASVPPIIGLYTSLFPVLVCALFSTSRHVNVGPMALTSILVADIVRRKAETLGMTSSTNNKTVLVEAATGFSPEERLHVDIASSVSLVSGVFLIVLAVCRLGVVTRFMGDAFISGYLAGGYIHVIFSQLKFFFGFRVPPYQEPFKLYYTAVFICKNITQANVASVSISAGSFLVLLLLRRFVNEKFNHKLRAPIPFEFLLVVIAILASRFGRLNERFDLPVILGVPKGVPVPGIPPLELIFSADILVEAFILALNSYLFCFVLMRMFAKKHNYQIDANQELYSLGLSTFIPAFFSCMATTASPPRTFLMDSTGGRSQFAYVVSALVVLISLLFVAPYMNHMPVCILAVLVIVASLPLFLEYKNFYVYWKTNRYDWLIWTVTAVTTLLLGVNKGMVIGIVTAAFVTVYRTQHSSTYLTAHVPKSEVYVSLSRHRGLKEYKGIRTIKFESPLYYGTLDVFRLSLYKELMNLRRESQFEGEQCSHGDDVDSTSSPLQPGPPSAVEPVDIPAVHVITPSGENTPLRIDTVTTAQSHENLVTSRAADKTSLHHPQFKNGGGSLHIGRMASSLANITSPAVTKGQLTNPYVSLSDILDTVVDDRAPKWRSNIEYTEAVSFSSLIAPTAGGVPSVLGSVKTLDAASAADEETNDFLILDCSAISFIDTGGCRLLRQMNAELSMSGTTFLLASVPEGVRKVMKRVPECDSFLAENVYPTVHMAVLAAKQGQ